jgi:hypothetical protein
MFVIDSFLPAVQVATCRPKRCTERQLPGPPIAIVARSPDGHMQRLDYGQSVRRAFLFPDLRRFMRQRRCSLAGPRTKGRRLSSLNEAFADGRDLTWQARFVWGCSWGSVFFKFSGAAARFEIALPSPATQWASRLCGCFDGVQLTGSWRGLGPRPGYGRALSIRVGCQGGYKWSKPARPLAPQQGRCEPASNFTLRLGLRRKARP